MSNIFWALRFVCVPERENCLYWKRNESAQSTPSIYGVIKVWGSTADKTWTNHNLAVCCRWQLRCDVESPTHGGEVWGGLVFTSRECGKCQRAQGSKQGASMIMKHKGKYSIQSITAIKLELGVQCTVKTTQADVLWIHCIIRLFYIIHPFLCCCDWEKLLKTFNAWKLKVIF